MKTIVNISSSSKERSFDNRFHSSSAPQVPRLKINEIFYSIQGESLLVGKPTIFIRLATCNLRCRYCDTRYAFWEGRVWSTDDVMNEVRKHPSKVVCLTGGEPLGQKGIYPLMDQLLAEGYTVSLETGGGVSTSEVPNGIIKILDLKCPESGETDAMVWDNLNHLRSTDQVKFVVSSREDFAWSERIALENKLFDKATVLISPVAEKVAPRDLAEWTLASGLPFTMQLQLHKIVWGNQRGV